MFSAPRIGLQDSFKTSGHHEPTPPAIPPQHRPERPRMDLRGPLQINIAKFNENQGKSMKNPHERTVNAMGEISIIIPIHFVLWALQNFQQSINWQSNENQHIEESPWKLSNLRNFKYHPPIISYQSHILTYKPYNRDSMTRLKRIWSKTDLTSIHKIPLCRHWGRVQYIPCSSSKISQRAHFKRLGALGPSPYTNPALWSNRVAFRKNML